MFAHFLPLLFSVFAFSVSAADTGSVEPDLSLEPCINGAVSASGTFPTQAMEEQVNAYLAWSNQTGRPYYLFQVAGQRLSSAYRGR
jgi:hypothetical protein